MRHSSVHHVNSILRDRGFAVAPSGVGVGVGGSFTAESTRRRSRNSAIPPWAAKSTATVDSTQARAGTAALDELGDDSEKPRSHHPVYGALVIHAFAAAENATGGRGNINDTLRPGFNDCSQNEDHLDNSKRCANVTGTSSQNRRGKWWHARSASFHEECGGETQSLKTRCHGNENAKGEGPKGERSDHEKAERVGPVNAFRKDTLAVWPIGNIVGLPLQHLPTSPHQPADGDGSMPKSPHSTRDTPRGVVTSFRRDGIQKCRPSKGSEKIGDNLHRHPHRREGKHATRCMQNRAILYASGIEQSESIETHGHIVKEGGRYRDENSLSRSGDEMASAGHGNNEVVAHHPVYGVVPAFASICQLFAFGGRFPTSNANDTASDKPGLPSGFPIGSNSTKTLAEGDKRWQQDYQPVRGTGDGSSIGNMDYSANSSGKSTERLNIAATRHDPEIDSVEAVNRRRGPVRRKKRMNDTCLLAHDAFHVLSGPDGVSDIAKAGSTTTARCDIGEQDGSPHHLHSSARVVPPDLSEDEEDSPRHHFEQAHLQLVETDHPTLPEPQKKRAKRVPAA